MSSQSNLDRNDKVSGKSCFKTDVDVGSAPMDRSGSALRWRHGTQVVYLEGVCSMSSSPPSPSRPGWKGERVYLHISNMYLFSKNVVWLLWCSQINTSIWRGSQLPTSNQLGYHHGSGLFKRIPAQTRALSTTEFPRKQGYLKIYIFFGQR